jgi:hypothetical protein
MGASIERGDRFLSADPNLFASSRDLATCEAVSPSYRKGLSSNSSPHRGSSTQNDCSLTVLCTRNEPEATNGVRIPSKTDSKPSRAFQVGTGILNVDVE